MTRRLLTAAILAFWLLMTGWLLRYEVFPERFGQALAGYRSLLPSGPLVLDAWMKITFQGQPIGYSHTQIDTAERNPAEQYKVANETRLRLNILNEPQTVLVSSEATLDALYSLQRFQFALHSGRFTTELDGRRSGARRFTVRLTTGGNRQRLNVDIPDEAVLYSPMLELSLRRLQPGQQLRLKTFDPASLSTAEVLVRATGRETRTVLGRPVPTTAFVLNYQGLECRGWMDGQGRVVRQETPWGWAMELCTADEALALPLRAAQAGGDLLQAMAVPCEGRIRDPRACQGLRLKLSGFSLPPEQLASPRQRVEAQAANTVTLRLVAARPPARDAAAPLADAVRQTYLRATPLIQSDHPDLIRQARRVVGARTDPVDQARALCAWVYRALEKKPTPSLPSALEVLRVRQGDCNEHTYLFVALARAVGLPAQIRVGLVYQQGAFYYHAWPAVYAGGWWELDPTLGQENVDATHLALLEGELAEQMKLLGLIGRLKAQVLAQEYDDQARSP